MVLFSPTQADRPETCPSLQKGTSRRSRENFVDPGAHYTTASPSPHPPPGIGNAKILRLAGLSLPSRVALAAPE